MKIPLLLPPGLNTDETSFVTPGWRDGNNVRFKDGLPEARGGWEEFHETLLSGVCRAALSWTDRLARSNVAFGTHTKLYVVVDGDLYDITPAGLTDGEIDSVYYDGGYGSGGYGMGGYGVGGLEEQARVWSLANYGESLIAAPTGSSPYIWNNDPSQVATALSNAPVANRFIVTSTRQVCAINTVQEDGLANTMCARFSDVEDPTSWTTSPSNLASEEIFEGGGKLVGGVNFGEDLLILSDTSLFHLQFTGDALAPWRKTKVADGCGLAGSQAIAVVNQTAYWMTPDFQFYAYTYGGSPVPIPCPIRRELSQNIVSAQVEKVVATTLNQFQEIRWYYPDARDGDEISRDVTLCIADGSWSKGDVARTAAIDSGPLLYPLAVDYDGQTYLHEKGDDGNGEALTGFIESSLQYLGDGSRNMLARGIWPDFKDQVGDLSLTLRTKGYPQASERVKGPYTLAPGREKKDFMAEGRLFAIRLEWDSAPAFWRGGKPVFDAVATGER